MKLTKTVAVLALSVAAAHYAVADDASLMYVRRGLVAQYDGINNAGTGSHDPSATKWKNLVGDSSLDGTCDTTKLSWNGSNGWTVSSDCKPVTVGSGLAAAMSAGSFTVQFAVKPTMSNKRECFFGQYKESDGISIEHNASGVTSGYLRWFRNSGTLNSASANKSFSDVKILAGKFASASAVFDKTSSTETHTFRVIGDDGDVSQSSTSPKLGSLSSTCESVIGGEVQRTGRTDSNYTSGYGITFQGTYYAFRVYNVALTAVEVAWNAGLDAVRFNGADAATVLGPEYSYDAATDTLTTDATYYAPKPGTDAADGLKFDLSFTGDKAADGLTFSESNADDKQGYISADVALPVLPTVTNANTTCLYFPTPSDTAAKSTYRQDARKADTAVMGRVATVFCRFRWDGSVQPSEVNCPSIIMNGYTSWSAHPNEGFLLRLKTAANSTHGYFSLVVPNLAVDDNNAFIVKTGTQYINAGRWVDVFASVYPSPTNPTLSNADIWFCEVPSWNTQGYFNKSEIGHYHFTDGCKIPRMNTTTQKTVIFGSEPNPEPAAITGANIGKCFRGAIACAKGWDRLLSENEMWTVMAGLGGVQSFTDLSTVAGRTYTTCYIDTDDFREGRNGTQSSFLGGDDPAAHRWRSLTQTYKTNTLVFDAPKGAKTYPYVYKTKINNASGGKTQPIHLEVNGTKVWPTDADSKDVAKGEEIKVEIGEELTLPGLNELKWVYDTTETSNWIIFGYHQLKVDIHSGLMLILW